ncbi:unnamed protein product [Ambrosiozyma monospora]|uniref:Unnamed protein product n=1 Tax=Ambrosiozyma monospora TaxID=43982 RepID=A0ACB5T2N6_AMBMO|nr:unnamed protein product [Ambrosiozyma monospora]
MSYRPYTSKSNKFHYSPQSHQFQPNLAPATNPYTSKAPTPTTTFSTTVVVKGYPFANDSRPYDCVTCGKRYTRPYLKNHIQTVHTANRVRYTCAKCPKEYLSVDDLHTHLNIHTDRYECP